MTLRLENRATQLLDVDRHHRSTGEFVETYLVGRGVRAAVARKVAREADRAVAWTPSWHASRSGRLLVHIWLFRALVDGGHRSRSAALIADLLGELSAG
jgi:hypothetical protein